MSCKFSEIEQQNDPNVYIGQDVITRTTKFMYLGSIIQNSREIDGDVTHQIQVSWLKWRTTICNKKFPTRLKGKFY